MLGRALRWSHAGAAVAMALLVSSCVKDKIVYRDAPRFQQPPTAAVGFLGYNDQANKKTTCGNCHVGHQTLWQETKHARAWADLQASGHSQAVCEACHTTSDKGNSADAGGYTNVKDTRYYDVQCESCHGPGLTHVTNPDVVANQPLASLKVDTTLQSSCAECHNGIHTPFVEEWKQSNHATMELSWSHGTKNNPACQGCHTGQGALKAWGVQANYREKDFAHGDTLQIVCGVCHDPHSNRASAGTDPQRPTGGQLRYDVGSRDETQNLCIKCHQRRANPDMTAQNRGPHSPEGPTLLGHAGWFPPNTTFLSDTIVATHGSERNPRLCATCHVAPLTVTDKVTGAFSFQSYGHLFLATPCLDQTTGQPIPGDCVDAQRTFQACTGSGCHGTEQAARSALSTAELRISNLLVTLQRQLRAVPCTEYVSTDTKYTTAEGSRFNYLLAAEGGTSTDPGTPSCANRALPAPVANAGPVVHNPFLVEALLLSSINQMTKDYGVTVSAGLNLQRELKSH